MSIAKYDNIETTPEFEHNYEIYFDEIFDGFDMERKAGRISITNCATKEILGLESHILHSIDTNNIKIYKHTIKISESSFTVYFTTKQKLGTHCKIFLFSKIKNKFNKRILETFGLSDCFAPSSI